MHPTLFCKVLDVIQLKDKNNILIMDLSIKIYEKEYKQIKNKTFEALDFIDAIHIIYIDNMELNKIIDLSNKEHV